MPQDPSAVAGTQLEVAIPLNEHAVRIAKPHATSCASVY